MNETDIMLLLGELESSTKSAHKRIDEIKELVESIHKLTAAIQSQQQSIENMTKRIEKMENKPSLPPCQHTNDFKRINELEEAVAEIREKPSKRWDKFVTALITSLAGLAVGYVWAVLFK